MDAGGCPETGGDAVTASPEAVNHPVDDQEPYRQSMLAALRVASGED